MVTRLVAFFVVLHAIEFVAKLKCKLKAGILSTL